MDAETPKTVEVTHSFPRDVPIDCRGWVEFTIVESTYRNWRIRYKATMVDVSDSESLESMRTREKDPQKTR